MSSLQFHLTRPTVRAPFDSVQRIPGPLSDAHLADGRFVTGSAYRPCAVQIVAAFSGCIASLFSSVLMRPPGLLSFDSPAPLTAVAEA